MLGLQRSQINCRCMRNNLNFVRLRLTCTRLPIPRSSKWPSLTASVNSRNRRSIASRIDNVRFPARRRAAAPDRIPRLGGSGGVGGLLPAVQEAATAD